MTERPELSIGEFARRSRLPVSTLRYYDRIGLLAPALVDPGSGYRRYAPAQLPAATLIARLRALGVAPDGIARIVAGGPPAAAALRAARRHVEDQIETGRLRLRLLDELLAEQAPHPPRVELVTLRAREVAAAPFLLPAAGLEAGVTRAIASLRSALRRAGLPRTGAWGATFPVDLTGEVAGFVFAPVDRLRPGYVDSARLPAARAVETAHRGSPATLAPAYRAVFAEIDRLGARPAGPVIEEYPWLDAPGAPAPVVHVRVPIDEPARPG